MSTEEKIIEEPKYSKLLSIDMKNLALAAQEAEKNKTDSECYYDTKSKSLTVKFPEEFVRSQRRKFVKLLSFKMILKYEDGTTDSGSLNPVAHNINVTPDYYGLHADFDQDFEKLNLTNYICNSNEILNQPLTYEQYTTKPTFRLQIVDEVDSMYYKNNAAFFPLIPETPTDPTKKVIQPTNYQANVRLLLVY